MYVHQEENKRRIYELMEAHGVYSEGMREQVWICAKIMSKVDDIEKYMKEDGYHMLQKIQSSQGERYDVHPLERMYMRYLTMAQTAIKALGLNRDSKPVRDVQNDDALSNLISSIGEEE